MGEEGVAVEVADTEDADLDKAEPEPIPDPKSTRVEISIDRPTPDLPEVFGLGEPVSVAIALSVEDGPGIAQATLEVDNPSGDRLTLQTDEQGRCGLTWDADRLGDLTVAVEFEATRLYLASLSSASFRVVDFREEIVRLYNDYLDWAEGQMPSASGRTPRELEAILSSSGLSLDYRAVDEIISRFEEADYSEHPIGRRQYEAMYRAWRTVVEEEAAQEEPETGE